MVPRPTIPNRLIVVYRPTDDGSYAPVKSKLTFARVGRAAAGVAIAFGAATLVTAAILIAGSETAFAEAGGAKGAPAGDLVPSAIIAALAGLMVAALAVGHRKGAFRGLAWLGDRAAARPAGRDGRRCPSASPPSACSPPHSASTGTFLAHRPGPRPGSVRQPGPLLHHRRLGGHRPGRRAVGRHGQQPLHGRVGAAPAAAGRPLSEACSSPSVV